MGIRRWLKRLKWRRACRIQDEHLREDAERRPYYRRLAPEELAEIAKPLPPAPDAGPRRPEPKSRTPSPRRNEAELLWEPPADIDSLLDAVDAANEELQGGTR